MKIHRKRLCKSTFLNQIVNVMKVKDTITGESHSSTFCILEWLHPKKIGNHCFHQGWNHGCPSLLRQWSLKYEWHEGSQISDQCNKTLNCVDLAESLLISLRTLMQLSHTTLGCFCGFICEELLNLQWIGPDLPIHLEYRRPPQTTFGPCFKS